MLQSVLASTKRFLCALAFCFGLAASGQAQTTVALSLDEARAAAQQAALSGNFELARELAAALLQADPNDRAALIVLAAVEPRLGRPDQGRMAGARAWRLATTDGQKYEAARLAALAAANEDRLTLSQIWLRRAATVAPSPAALAQTQQDYAGLRSLNPWRTDIQLSFSPSSNVNGGSNDIYNVIDGLPFVGVLSGDARALSGVTATADVRLSYRLAETSQARTEIAGRFYSRQVFLSDAARALAPDSENGDFATTFFEVGVGHKRARGDAIVMADFDIGANWSGGDLSTPFARLSFAGNVPIAAQWTGSAGIALEQRWQGNSGQIGDVVQTLNAGLAYQLDGGAQIAGTVELRDTQSDSGNLRNTATSLQLTYVPGEQIGPAEIVFTLGASVTDYPDYAIILPVPGGRQDVTQFASAEFAFVDFDYAGFAPVVTLGAQRSDSNVSRFDRSAFSIRFGFRSTF